LKAIIAFDVDGTLNISGGPIPATHLLNLQRCGLVIGVLGNWRRAFDSIKGLDFYQAGIPSKAEILKALGTNKAFKLYVADTDADREEALKAGWNFIYAKDYRYG